MTRGFTGLVLAGGRSSRMGRDKALLEFRGATLLDRAIGLLQEAGAVQVTVSGNRGVDGVPDAWPGAGPVGGLASALPRCPDGAVVVVPVDMPMLDTVALRVLVDALVDAPAARFDGHPLPWAARVDAPLRTAVATLMRDVPSGPSVRALHAAVGGVDCGVRDARALRNVNTPAEWEAMRP